MTKADILRMAREAGLQPYYNAQEPAIVCFANLVAAHKAEVALAEAYRCGYKDGMEAAAVVCEQPIDEIQITDDCSEIRYMDGKECAAAIRARGTT